MRTFETEELSSLEKNLFELYPGIKQLLEHRSRRNGNKPWCNFVSHIQYRNMICQVNFDWRVKDGQIIVAGLDLDLDPTIDQVFYPAAKVE